MPKNKLTDEKRDALRQEIKRGVKAGTPQARILETLSKKYGVSSEAIRYYLKALTKKTGLKAKKAAVKGAPKGAKPVKVGKGKASKSPKSIVKPQARKARAKFTSRGLAALRISDAVKGLTAKDLERALQARNLLPALEASRARAESLRAKAREAAVQAARLERQFRKLVR